MKLSELERINEDINTEDEFYRDLENILFAGYANKLKKINTKSLAKQMITMGYQTSLNHIAQVAQTIPIVSNASINSIELGEDIVDDMADSNKDAEDDSEADVSDMAQQSAIDNVKRGD